MGLVAVAVVIVVAVAVVIVVVGVLEEVVVGAVLAVVLCACVGVCVIVGVLEAKAEAAPLAGRAAAAADAAGGGGVLPRCLLAPPPRRLCDLRAVSFVLLDRKRRPLGRGGGKQPQIDFVAPRVLCGSAQAAHCLASATLNVWRQVLLAQMQSR